MAVWRGSREIEEQADSPEETYEAASAVQVRRFHGPIDILRTRKPKINDQLAGSPDDMRVKRVRIRKQPGGESALMIVELHSTKSGFPLAVAGGGEEPRFEEEWTSMDKPLERHPRFSEGGTHALTEFDLADIQGWERESNPKLRKDYKYHSPDDDNADSDGNVTLSNNAKVFAKLKKEGVESYLVPAPTIRRSHKTYKKPPGKQLGKLGAPNNFPSLPPGYVWLSTAARALREGGNGPYQVEEEWTGADEWATFLYEQV